MEHNDDREKRRERARKLDRMYNKIILLLMAGVMVCAVLKYVFGW